MDDYIYKKSCQKFSFLYILYLKVIEIHEHMIHR